MLIVISFKLRLYFEVNLSLDYIFFVIYFLKFRWFIACCLVWFIK